MTKKTKKTTKRSCSTRERNRAHDRGFAALAAYNRRCGDVGRPKKPPKRRSSKRR